MSRRRENEAIAGTHVQPAMQQRTETPSLPRIGGRFALALAVALAYMAPSAANAQGQMRRPLNRAEQARLNQGRVVVREATERRGPLRLFGGTSYIVVDMPVADAWRIINDDSRQYRHMLPQVHSTREVSRNGNLSLIHI